MANRKTKNDLSAIVTPNSKLKDVCSSKKDKKVICPVCDDIIEDATSKKKGHDSIFCEGTCNMWLHRGCAGLSKSAFLLVTQSTDSFYCPHCRLDIQDKEISSLKDAIASLSKDLTVIKSLIDISSKSSDYTTASAPAPGTSDTSKSSKSNLTPSKSKTKAEINPPFDHHPDNNTKPNTKPKPERKFNIVDFGIQERPQGSSRYNRWKHDLDEVTSIFSTLDESFQINSVRDCYRLGRYSVNRPRPRPVMVNLNSTVVVVNLLSKKKNSLMAPISIKPDLSPEGRKTEAVLLKERWRLIQSGTLRNSIKIRNQSLYIDDSLHGSVVNFEFQPHPPPPSSNSTINFPTNLDSTSQIPSPVTSTVLTSNSQDATQSVYKPVLVSQDHTVSHPTNSD